MENKELYVPRTDHSDALYRAVIGHALDGAHLIADVGAGDSNFADRARSRGQDVIRFDAQYGKIPPEGIADYFVADARNMSNVPDEKFDAVVSVLMMQHLEHDNGDVTAALEEMIRITKTANFGDNNVGNILVYPVWRPKEISLIIEKLFPRSAVVGYAENNNAFDDLPEEYRHQTLQIRKTALLTPEIAHELCSLIESTKALKKPTTPSDMGRRAIIRLTGKTKRSLSK